MAMARELIVQWYGEDPQASPDLCRVVNSRHFSRIMNLLNTTKVSLLCTQYSTTLSPVAISQCYLRNQPQHF